MTCVVGTVDESGRVHLGADSSAVDDNQITSHVMPKVFKLGEFGIGYCHSFRLGQIIEYSFTPPPLPKKANENELLHYMIKEFIPTLRTELEIQQYPLHDDEKTDWSLLVGIRGHLFTIEPDYHLGYDDENYAAIGAGAEYALGAMFASDYSGSDLVSVGLMAADAFCPYVTKPFHFIEV